MSETMNKAIKANMEQRKIEDCRMNFTLRLKREEEENKKSRRKAVQDVEEIKSYLVNEAGVKEIYLFGSIVEGSFRKNSDLDIAISGFDERNFFSIWSHLDEFTDFNVDLVDLDEKDDFFRRQIRERGQKIYEKG
ncbi:MAG: nucleotidyltransferase domain-containing protein [bacterium]|nr:nucleotidyltransferase domain-containing protein [bacterium]